MKVLLSILVSLLFVQCSPSTKDILESRSPGDDLSYEYAMARRKQIKNVDYMLELSFERGEKKFLGKTLIDVQLNNINSPLTIDFLGKIKSITANGSALSDYSVQEGFFTIPPKALSKKMDILIEYEQEFKDRPEGLFYFKDPKDGKEYIYSNLEPYDAHHFFPCFDQPNLKASYHVTLKVPRTWEAISNQSKIREKNEGKRKIVEFDTSKKLSTYLLFIGAGDYKKWTNQNSALPMAIYARESLAEFMDEEELFSMTEKGLSFYSKYFNYPYPFSKYDHVFVPAFTSGAMENPGAVTMNERMIFRGPVDRTIRASRANTLLHEMVHMWFGDLVTMNWWNDLWLNESFATYLAYIGQDRALGNDEAWNNFYRLKGWAYWQDQLVTTHPIEDRKDLSVQFATTNFDGITYAKGAASLKQLHYFVGERAFKKGLENYFDKYQWKNTQRKDFIAAIAAQTKKNLNSWTKKWLKQSGINEISSEWSCENDKVSKFQIIQGPTSTGAISPHASQIGLYKKEGEGLKNYKSYKVNFSSKKNKIKRIIGAKCPDFIYTNRGDYDYGLHYLDPKSLEFLKENFLVVKDNFLAAMLWDTLYQMVYNQKMNTQEYLNLVLEYLPKIDDFKIQESILRRGFKNAYLGFLEKTTRDAYAKKIETMAFTKIKKEKPGSDSFFLWLDTYINLARSPEALEKIALLLKPKNWSGLNLKQTRRWDVIFSLSRHNYEGASKLINKELKSNQTEYAKMMALSSRVSIPVNDNKKVYWDKLIKSGELSWGHKRQALDAFHHNDYLEVTEEFYDKFFDFIVKADKEMKQFEIKSYFALFPKRPSKEVLEKSKKRYEAVKSDLKDWTNRYWQERNDMLQRVIDIQQY